MGGEETGVTESTQKCLARNRLFFAGKHSTHGADVGSAERRELPIRARCRSGNDFAGLSTGSGVDMRNCRREAGRKNCGRG